MNWTVVQRILGLLLMMFSLTMLPPIVFSVYYDDHSWLPFVEGFGLTLAAGQFFGAKLGVHLQVLKGQAWVRKVLTVAIVAFAIKLVLG